MKNSFLTTVRIIYQKIQSMLFENESCCIGIGSYSRIPNKQQNRKVCLVYPAIHTKMQCDLAGLINSHQPDPSNVSSLSIYTIWLDRVEIGIFFLLLLFCQK